MTQKQELLELLVVEDESQNVAAAREFFGMAAQSRIRVTYCSDFESARFALVNPNYFVGAIIDAQFPSKAGGAPEKLAQTLWELAREHKTPPVIFASDKHHTTADVSQVYVDDWSWKHGIGYVMGAPKNTVSGWQTAYAALTKLCPVAQMEENSRAKQRKFGGNYTKLNQREAIKW